MTPVPTFTGTIRNGRVKWDRPADVVEWSRTLEDKPVEITIRQRRTKRSDQQNRAWWGLIVPAIADHLGYDRHEYEMVHYALVAKCFGVTVRDGIEVPNARSSQLNTAQFTELMDWAVRYAATEWGLVVPLPNEPEMAA